MDLVFAFARTAVSTAESALQTLDWARNLVTQNYQLRNRIANLEATIETLEDEAKRLRAKLQKTDELYIKQYREMICLDNEVSYLKTGASATSRAALFKDLEKAKTSAAAAVEERNQILKVLQGARQAQPEALQLQNIRGYIENGEVAEVIIKDLEARDNVIADYAAKVADLTKLIDKQLDLISDLRIEAEIAREKAQKEWLQQALRRLAPELEASAFTSDTSSDELQDGEDSHSAPSNPVLIGINQPLPREPIDIDRLNYDVSRPTSDESRKPHAWRRMRDEHERSVQEEAENVRFTVEYVSRTNGV
ncbi:uncharacterized protein CcaverHIS019_0502630 [Cutaneotrichosporon cavernicola]|uniref:Uncharacterized protein n=1 Tax=Cutaneotrichosporon cavernicola TaxID=279322 RepID=A0AA48L651_9TREE|nr:uncharacterized protein CcaverHIS019_0502630 [Cutaneotrichosporon cavernicola]BEI92635.1 hypothetical protein CcaverHIS019_0502630 [Cutaneotrichosporon cavernicola]